LEVTREKLRDLEDLYEGARKDRDNKELRAIELISLKGLINQLKEEIVRFRDKSGGGSLEDTAKGEPSLTIPAFDKRGNLPPGVYRVTLAEIADRFGRGSETRREQMDSLRWLVELAVKAGIERIVVDGSFVTRKKKPNDVDCVLLVGPHYPKDANARQELLEGLPFVHIQLVDQAGFDEFLNRIFATDRNQNPRGMIEVIL
jgi:hypothetical protein